VRDVACVRRDYSLLGLAETVVELKSQNHNSQQEGKKKTRRRTPRSIYTAPLSLIHDAVKDEKNNCAEQKLAEVTQKETA